MLEFFRLAVRRPRALALRRWLFQIHLWTGIGVGLYLFAMSITGSALVFREELEAAYPGEAKTVEVKGERAPLEQVRLAVANRFPEYRVAWIREPDRRDVAHDVWFEKGEDARLALVDPYGARFLCEVGSTTTIWTFLQNLHFYLFSGRTGLVVNGVGGLLLALLCGTGVMLWWPGSGKWRRALRVSRKSGWKRLNWDLHGAVGMWTLLFVGTWSITGAYFAFPQLFAVAIGSVAPMNPPVPSPAAPAGDARVVPVDTLVRQALAIAPGYRPVWIGLPHHEGDNTAVVQLARSGLHDRYELTSVYLNPFNGKPLEVRTPGDLAWGDRILLWLARLHFGDFGGAGVKALWAVVGLTPALLFVTGFLMWWNRVLSKLWRRQGNGEKIANEEDEKILQRSAS